MYNSLFIFSRNQIDNEKENNDDDDEDEKMNLISQTGITDKDNKPIFRNEMYESEEIKKIDSQQVKKKSKRGIFPSFDDFIKTKNMNEFTESNFKNFKSNELKKFAKNNKLHSSGTKDLLAKRIIDFLIKNNCIVVIQKTFRGHIVRESYKLRGPAFKSFRDYKNIHSICVNETDPYSLEPINEISFEKIISLSDSKNFIYVFDITSLIKAMNKSEKMFNPYCREIIDDSKIKMISKLNNILKIIFPNFIWENDEKSNKISKNMRHRRRFLHNSANSISNIPPFVEPMTFPQNLQNLMTEVREMTEIENNTLRDISHNMNSSSIENIVIFSTSYNEQQKKIYEKLLNLQKEPLENRIRELFFEMDLLGNYTNDSWFQNLSNSDYRRYYNYLHDIWRYRANLSYSTKKKICSLYDPFQNTQQYINSNIKDLCVSIMENIVYSGIDEDFRKIGAMHVLSALTFVSYNARTNMPWLYESYN